MKIIITLGEVLNRCNDWEYFCEKQGYSVYCVAEGADEHDIELTEKEAVKYGLIFMSL